MAGHLTREPAVVTRPPQPYVAIRRVVTMSTLGEIADRIPDVFGWAEQRGLAPTGAPFLRYLVIDMDGELEIEAGVPLATVVDGDADVVADVLPGGRYVTASEVGHPDRLVDVVSDLLEWARDRGLTWDMTTTPRGQEWGCRLEIYPTDLREEPDMNRMTNELAFRLAD